MEEGLYYICLNHPVCNHGVHSAIVSTARGDSYEYPELPVGGALNELDLECSTCPSRVFSISSKKCPVCGNNIFEPQNTGDIPLLDLNVPVLRYAYKCNQCQTLMVSEIDIMHD